MLAGEACEAQQLLVVEVVPHKMGLDVKHELPCETFRPRQHHFGLSRLGRRDLEDVAVDLVHGEKGGRHTAARTHELPAVQAEPFGVKFGQLINARFDLLLSRALRRRQILAVRYNLSRNRCCGRCRLGACDKALFSFTEPSSHCRPPLFECSRPFRRPLTGGRYTLYSA